MNQHTFQKLEVAVTPWQAPSGSADGLCEQAELAEQLGFHSFWLPENHFGDDRAIPSPLTLLAAVAARTRHILLGTTSYLLPIRHPIQAAEEVAVVDQLSNGRLILGLGRGVQPAMFDIFDVDPKRKRKIFEENLNIMLTAWRGDPIPGTGEPTFLKPLPVQQPHPTLWVAAFGPLALKQAAKLGYPYLASPMETLDALAANYELFNSEIATNNLPEVQVVPVMRTVLITGDKALKAEVCKALEASAPHAMRESSAAVSDWTLIGDASYVADKIAEYRERTGMTHLIARGRIPAVDTKTQIASHEALLRVESLK